jgi:hypothetical protein
MSDSSSRPPRRTNLVLLHARQEFRRPASGSASSRRRTGDAAGTYLVHEKEQSARAPQRQVTGSPLQCNASPGYPSGHRCKAATRPPHASTCPPASARRLANQGEASGAIAPPSGHLRELQHAGVAGSLLSCRWLAASSVQGPRARFARVAGMHCSCSSGDSTCCSSRQIMSQWCTCALRASQSRCPRLQSAAKRPSA